MLRTFDISRFDITLPNGMGATILDGELTVIREDGAWQPAWSDCPLLLHVHDDADSEIRITLPSTSPVLAGVWNWLDTEG